MNPNSHFGAIILIASEAGAVEVVQELILILILFLLSDYHKHEYYQYKY